MHIPSDDGLSRGPIIDENLNYQSRQLVFNKYWKNKLDASEMNKKIPKKSEYYMKIKYLKDNSRNMRNVNKIKDLYKLMNGKQFLFENEREIRTSASYYKKLLNIEMLITFLSFLSIFVTVFYYEISYYKGKEKDDKKYLILLFTLDFISLMTIIALFIKEKFKFQYKIEMKTINKGSDLITSGKWKKLLFYTISLLIQPNPLFFQIYFSSETEIGDNKIEKVDIAINFYIAFFVFFRVIFIVRGMLYASVFMNPETEFACKELNFNMDLFFSLKCQAIHAPMFLYFSTLIFLLLILAYLLRICERPYNDIFDNYLDAAWLIIATMTTVGYGDITALTDLGRVISIISCLCGVILVSMILVTISSMLNLKPYEENMLGIIKHSNNLKKKENLARDLISSYFKNFQRRSKKGKNSSKKNILTYINENSLPFATKKKITVFKDFLYLTKQTETDYIWMKSKIEFFQNSQAECGRRKNQILKELKKLNERIKNLKKNKNN